MKFGKCSCKQRRYFVLGDRVKCVYATNATHQEGKIGTVMAASWYYDFLDVRFDDEHEYKLPPYGYAYKTQQFEKV